MPEGSSPISLPSAPLCDRRGSLATVHFPRLSRAHAERSRPRSLAALQEGSGGAGAGAQGQTDSQSSSSPSRGGLQQGTSSNQASLDNR